MLPSGSGSLAEVINTKIITLIPLIPNLIPRIPTPIPCITTLIPPFPIIPTQIPIIPTLIPSIPIIPSSAHSVPRFPIPAFTDSLMEACDLNNLYVVIQKTMSPRKSKEDVMIRLRKS